MLGIFGPHTHRIIYLAPFTGSKANIARTIHDWQFVVTESTWQNERQRTTGRYKHERGRRPKHTRDLRRMLLLPTLSRGNLIASSEVTEPGNMVATP